MCYNYLSKLKLYFSLYLLCFKLLSVQIISKSCLLSVDPKFFEVYFAQTMSSHEAICVSNQDNMYFYYLLIKDEIIIYIYFFIFYFICTLINKFIYKNFNINLIFTININLNYFS